MTIVERARALAWLPYADTHTYRSTHTHTHTHVHTYTYIREATRAKRRQRGIHKIALYPHWSWLSPLSQSHPSKRITNVTRAALRIITLLYRIGLTPTRPLLWKIFISIVDRLTTAERLFSTPPTRSLGQSALIPPAILVHQEAARTCIVLLHP